MTSEESPKLSNSILFVNFEEASKTPSGVSFEVSVNLKSELSCWNFKFSVFVNVWKRTFGYA
jgi:hypothetical protein